MVTEKQKLGEFGEQVVVKECACPQCKQSRTLKKLVANFKCADIICEFCGYIAQVKANTQRDITRLPKRILGAAWGPQKERMDSAIYFPLFIVLYSSEEEYSIWYFSSDLQQRDIFVPRTPLKETARRAGWQGFYYDLTKVPEGAILRIK